jgi:hypothetical protein
MTMPPGPSDSPYQPSANPAGVPAPPTVNPFATGSLGAAGPAPTYGSPDGVPGVAHPAPDYLSNAGGEDLGRAALRSATITFFVGVGIVLAGLGTIIWASGDGGGVLWYGGLVFGGVVLFRGLVGLVGARKAGARLTAGRIAGLGAGVVACLAAGVIAVVAYAAPGSITPHVATDVGSCWTVTVGDKLNAVDCGAAHDLVASQVVTDKNTCPDSTVGTADGDTAGTVLCLTKAG